MECQFFSRIGACRHGEKCLKRHTKPTVSATVMLPNFYSNPKLDKDKSEIECREIFENFYKDTFIRIARIDRIKEIVVCENENHHMNGNVYVKFFSPESAKQAVMELNQEWYNKRPVHCELSPVRNFNDANCKAYDEGSCERGYNCNYMHIIRPKDDLFKAQEKSYHRKRIEEARAVKEEREAPQKEPQQAPEKDFKSTVQDLFAQG